MSEDTKPELPYSGYVESESAVSVDPPATSTKSGALGTILAAVAAVVVIALAVAVVILGKGYLDDRATEQARTDAVAAASDQAAAMLSYDYNEVDQQLAAAADGLTGDFREEYTKLVEGTIAPGAKEKKLTVQATVQAGSVVSATPDDVVVLLFVNQITTSADVPDAATTGSRVRMEMHKDGDRWLTGRLTPV
ncbi:h domain protein [Rhodococcus gannanensis]|uniref:H domain protein n=1 Tax=Rhodococcus gannanensis TaxID=1960308 RepID=A0ABW4PEV6_9NOCA